MSDSVKTKQKSIFKRMLDAPVDNPVKTIVIAIIVCLFASALVTSASLFLKEKQDLMALNEKRKNILIVAGIYDNNKNIEEQFENIEAKVLKVNTGEFENSIEPNFNEIKFSKDPETSRELTRDEDIASIYRQSNFKTIYFVKKESFNENKGSKDLNSNSLANNEGNGNENLDDNSLANNENNQAKTNSRYSSVILPVHGYGLWSTLYGFISIGMDGNTINGLKFYQQKETPGLGGEVDNPKWRKEWEGKKIIDENNKIISVVKNSSGNNISSLSGATLTSRGVNNLIHFWLGKEGYDVFLNKIKNGEIK